MSKYATKARLFEVVGRLDKTFKPKLNEEVSPDNNDKPENIAVSPVGGVVEKSEINEAQSISPIHNYVYFAYNYPSDFIEKAWAEDPNMVQHLKSKFDGFYKQYGAGGVMNKFYTELDNENQKTLEDWIMANYHG